MAYKFQSELRTIDLMNEAQKKEVSDKAAVAALADWEEGVVTGVA